MKLQDYGEDDKIFKTLLVMVLMEVIVAAFGYLQIQRKCNVKNGLILKTLTKCAYSISYIFGDLGNLSNPQG